MHLLFSIVFSSLFIFINIYIYKRHIKKLFFTKIRKFLLAFLIINYIFILFYGLGKVYFNINLYIYYIFSSSIGIIFILFTSSVIFDILNSINNKVHIQEKRRTFIKIY